MAWLGKAMKFLGGVLLVVLAILVANTLRLPDLPAADGAKFPPIKDLAAAAKRLSAAIQIPTISYGFANPPGGNRFPDLHKLIEESFPLVHKHLKREIVAESSLLYTWEGSDKSLPPILLSGHQDVVPIEPGTEQKWTHPPFSGQIADGFIWGRGTLDNKQQVMATLMKKLAAPWVRMPSLTYSANAKCGRYFHSTKARPFWKAWYRAPAAQSRKSACRRRAS